MKPEQYKHYKHKLYNKQAIIIVLQAIHQSPTGKNPSNILMGQWLFNFTSE
jgi:hypothetical protein